MLRVSRRGGPGGRTGGSPFLDYNFLVRSTIADEMLRFDVFLGFAYHTSMKKNNASKGLLKYGGELRWKVAPGVFGLLLKFNRTKSTGTGGIGLYFGWDQ